MVAQQNSKRNITTGRGPLIICFVLFAAFFINVLIGKANISYALKLPHLGSVAEFLLLTVASVSLIVAALKSEAAEK